MDEQPLVSIIIPCFCAQKTIERCLGSIKLQSYKKYEIIIIDDCSTDNTCSIIENMHIKGIRIKKNDKNCGASFCRNLGVKIANGTIVVFIDSDDWIEPFFLENLMKSQMQYSSDIVIAGLTRHSKKKISRDMLILPTSISQKEFVKSLLTRTITPVCYSKAFRRSFLIENNLKFEDYRFGEDIDFVFRLAQYNPVISCINNIEYHVVDTQGSICNMHDDRIIVLFDVDDNIKEYLIKMNLYHELRSLFEAYYAGTILNMVDYAVRFKDKLLVEKIINLSNKRNKWYVNSEKDSLKRKAACQIFKRNIKLYAVLRDITLKK